MSPLVLDKLLLGGVRGGGGGSNMLSFSALLMLINI